MSNPEPLAFLDSLSISKPAYCLYDLSRTPSECFYSLNETKVWDAAHGKLCPASIVQSTRFKVALSITGTNELKKHGNLFELTATLHGSLVFLIPKLDITNLANFQITAPSITVQQPGSTKRKDTQKALPWMHEGSLEWEIRSLDASNKAYKCSTEVEIYTLPQNLASYYKRTGVPLRLLRLPELLKAWMQQKSVQSDQEWPKFAVEAIHHLDVLEYETYTGASRYLSWWDGNTGAFKYIWLDLWLSDAYEYLKTKTRQAICCYDLAALCQLVVGLGVDQADQIESVYLDPYGFIKPTRLIGRTENPPNSNNPTNLCNNPFYMNDTSYSKDMLFRAQDAGALKKSIGIRSSFGNHMFITCKKNGTPFVLDACCGPHAGDEDLDTYLKNAIDHDSTLYGAAPKLMLRPGEKTDVKTGPGVSEIVTSAVLERGPSSTTGSGLLLDALSQSITNGKWMQPSIGAPTDNVDRITATWTFTPQGHPSGEVFNISVVTFPAATNNAQSVIDQFNTRTHLLTRSPKDWVVTPVASGFHDAFNNSGTGTTLMFADESRLYLVVVNTIVEKANSPLLSTFKQSLKTELEKVFVPGGAKKAPYIQQIVYSSPQTKVGNEVTVTVKTTSAGAKVWRGYKVQTEDEGILFMGPVDSTPDLDLRFLALAPGKSGPNKAKIVLFGGNLESETKDLAFDVVN